MHAITSSTSQNPTHHNGVQPWKPTRSQRSTEDLGDAPKFLILIPTNFMFDTDYPNWLNFYYGDDHGPQSITDALDLEIEGRQIGLINLHTEEGGLIFYSNCGAAQLITCDEEGLLRHRGKKIAVFQPGPLDSHVLLLASEVIHTSHSDSWWFDCLGCGYKQRIRHPVEHPSERICKDCGTPLPTSWKESLEHGVIRLS